MSSYSWTRLTYGAVESQLAAVAVRHRGVIAELLAGIGEFDARALYAPAGYKSTYAWCVGVLHMSEDAALKRIQAARQARRFPQVLDAVADGRLNLSAVCTLAAWMIPANVDALIAAAAHKTQNEIRVAIAALYPRPDVRTRMRQLADEPNEHALTHVGMTRTEQPAPEPGADVLEMTSSPAASGAPAPPVPEPPATPAPLPAPSFTRVASLAPNRYELRGTMSKEMHDDLKAVLALLGHEGGTGEVMNALATALQLYRKQLEHKRFAATERPGKRRASGDMRYVPAQVKREVWKRDGGRCTFESESGHRCEARARLEYDHVKPFARGGRATVENLRLRCRTHNRLEAERTYGAGFMAAKREGATHAPCRRP